MHKQQHPGVPAGNGIVHAVLMGICATLMGMGALAPYLTRVIAAVTIFSGTFVVYFLSTITPSIGTTSYPRFRRSGPWWLLLIPAVLATFLLLDFLPETLVLQYLTAGGVGFSYYSLIKSGRFRFNGLRSIYLVKNIALALAWSLATAPFNTFQAETIKFFIYRFSFIMALSIAIDVRDMEDDKKNRIPTIPLRAGPGVSCLTACVLLVAGYLTLILQPCQYPDAQDLAKFAGMTSAAATCSVVLITFYRKKQFIRWIVDGNLLLHGLAFLFHHLKQATG